MGIEPELVLGSGSCDPWALCLGAVRESAQQICNCQFIGMGRVYAQSVVREVHTCIFAFYGCITPEPHILWQAEV